MALEQEYQFFQEIKTSLLQQGDEGKFVVIKDHECLDVFLTYEDALRQGLKKYGDVPFLVKEINAIEQINFFFHGVNVPCQASV